MHVPRSTAQHKLKVQPGCLGGHRCHRSHRCCCWHHRCHRCLCRCLHRRLLQPAGSRAPAARPWKACPSCTASCLDAAHAATALRRAPSLRRLLHPLVQGLTAQLLLAAAAAAPGMPPQAQWAAVERRHPLPAAAAHLVPQLALLLYDPCRLPVTGLLAAACGACRGRAVRVAGATIRRRAPPLPASPDAAVGTWQGEMGSLRGRRVGWLTTQAGMQAHRQLGRPVPPLPPPKLQLTCSRRRLSAVPPIRWRELVAKWTGPSTSTAAVGRGGGRAVG